VKKPNALQVDARESGAARKGGSIVIVKAPCCALPCFFWGVFAPAEFISNENNNASKNLTYDNQIGCEL